MTELSYCSKSDPGSATLKIHFMNIYCILSTFLHKLSYQMVLLMAEVAKYHFVDTQQNFGAFDLLTFLIILKIEVKFLLVSR